MNNPARPPRLPANFSPCTLTSRINRDRSLVVEFTFPPNCPDAAQFATGIVDAAAVLANLFGQFSRQIEQQARNQRADVNHEAWKIRQREVFRAYQEFRANGLQHRKAIRQLLIDQRFQGLRELYHWGSVEFNATVKSFLGPVPVSGSEAGGLSSPKPRRSKI